MTKFLHGLIHGVMIVAQFGNAFSGAVPKEYQPLVAALLAAIQAGVALYNHKTAA